MACVNVPLAKNLPRLFARGALMTRHYPPPSNPSTTCSLHKKPYSRYDDCPPRGPRSHTPSRAKALRWASGAATGPGRRESVAWTPRPGDLSGIGRSSVEGSLCKAAEVVKGDDEETKALVRGGRGWAELQRARAEWEKVSRQNCVSILRAPESVLCASKASVFTPPSASTLLEAETSYSRLRRLPQCRPCTGVKCTHELRAVPFT